MGAIRRFFLPLLKLGCPVLWNHFTWMYRRSKHPEKYDINDTYKRARKIITKACNALDVDLIVEGLENIPQDQNYLLVSNHISMIDPLLIIETLDKPITFVAKDEVAHYPFVSHLLMAIGGAYIDRSDLRQSLKVIQKVGDELAEGKKNWGIFVEGTRNKDYQKNLIPFHGGSFRPAVKSKSAILPIAIVGTNRVLKTHNIYKKYPVHIKILPPISYEEYKDYKTDEIAQICQDKIQRAISFDLRIKDHQYMLRNNKDRYKRL